MVRAGTYELGRLVMSCSTLLEPDMTKAPKNPAPMPMATARPNPTLGKVGYDDFASGNETVPVEEWYCGILVDSMCFLVGFESGL